MARHHIFATFVAILAFSPAVHAETMVLTTPPAPKVSDLKGLDTCESLGVGESAFMRTLQAYGEAFGKKGINWTTTDFQAVATLAQQCDGAKLSNGVSVRHAPWVRAINSARDTIYTINQTAVLVEQWSEKLTFIKAKKPACIQIADYVSDSWSWKDNSATIFGFDVMALPSQDLDTLVQYVNQCTLVVPDYASIALNMNRKAIDRLFSALMDKMLLIVKRRGDYERDPMKRPTDLIIAREGIPILPTFTGNLTREMIGLFNREQAMNRRFTPERIGQLMQMSDKIIAENRSEFDVLYAQVVREKCQDHIFRASDIAPSLRGNP